MTRWSQSMIDPVTTPLRSDGSWMTRAASPAFVAT